MQAKGTTPHIFTIPKEVSRVPMTLEKAGFEAYLVGGCVRDLILGKKPKDWDVTTNAKPEDIIQKFENTFYENKFGTVGVVNDELPQNEAGEPDQTLKVVEVTPYRLEAEYTDNRRPDAVTFSQKLEDDLQRRDFTINAIALKIKRIGDEGSDQFEGEIVDLYGGREDLKKKIIRTVGKPHERFKEDALRLMRAIRLASEHHFSIEKETEEAVKNDSQLLKNISAERVRDEFSRIIMSDRPMEGIVMAQKLGILGVFLPELEKAIGVEQGGTHAYDVWQHLLLSLQHAADKKWPLDIRLAALLHDISKPETRRSGQGVSSKEWTFFGHEVVGAKVAKQILTRLKFPKETIEKVTKLVRWHMFFTDTEQITLSAVRRMINNVGRDNIWDLMNVRICDRVGTGRPKENPYRLRKYKAMIEEALRDPISVSMLKVDGNGLIQMGITPGPRMGYILHALLEEVLEDPKLNAEEYLKNKVLELNKLSDKELKTLGEEGKEKKAEAEAGNIEEIRKKYKVE